jgi:hypothetical protein
VKGGATDVPAIKNFGYLWDRDRVFWGYPNVEGTLLGYHAQFGKVDFREQKGIYILHTQDLKVVYIGQVGAGEQSLFGRLKSHTKSDKLWNRWRYFSWFGWRRVNRGNHRLAKHAGGSPRVRGESEEFLDEIEAVLIQVVEPPLNRQGSRWKDTVQFEQADDEHLEQSDLPSIATKQAELAEQIESLAKRIQ